MPEKRPISIKNVLFREGSALGELTQKARSWTRLTERLRSLLPEDVGPHVLGITVHSGTAVVLTDSAAWASRLRFLKPELEAALTAILKAAPGRIDIKVRPPIESQD